LISNEAAGQVGAFSRAMPESPRTLIEAGLAAFGRWSLPSYAGQFCPPDACPEPKIATMCKGLFAARPVLLSTKEQDQFMSDHDGTLKRIAPRHLKILELAGQGMSNKDIARQLGVGGQTVSLVLKNPLAQQTLSARFGARVEAVQEEVARGESKAGETLRKGAELAAERLVGLVDSCDERVARQSAVDVLDRVLSKPGQGQGSQPPLVINADQVLILETVLRESMNSRSNAPAVERTDIDVSGPEPSFVAQPA
jgi:hypothetical protein